jgi:serine protease Do
MVKQKALVCATCWGVMICIFFMFTPFTGSAQIYKYKNEDGVWVFTDNPQDLPKEGVDVIGGVNKKSSRAIGADISDYLAKQMTPLNEIERSGLAVVAIKTPIGYGTGFFVTDTGYIVTNKHVLRLTPDEKERRETVQSEAEDKIKAIKKDLGLELERLELFKKQLVDYKKRMSELTNERDKAYAQENYSIELKRYQSWRTDFNKRKKAFQKKLSQYREKITLENYNASLSSLKTTFAIYLADNSELNARLVTVSKQYDLALLKLSGYKTPYLQAALPGSISQGCKVFAVGNPAMLKNSVSAGIMSGQEGIYIKTDAKIYPGNSGGPLITEEGRVMGVNTFKELTHKFEGLGFAISMDLILTEFASYISS